MRTNVTRQFRSRERKSTMWSFRSRERKCMGTKRPGTTGSPLTPRCKKHGAAEHLQQIRKIVGAFEFMITYSMFIRAGFVIFCKSYLCKYFVTRIVSLHKKQITDIHLPLFVHC